MKTKTKFPGAALSLAGLLLCLPAMALAEDAAPAGDNETRFENAASRLDLTAEQKEKIKGLRQSQREQMQALLQELRAKKQQLKDELNNPAATRESIAPLAAEIKTITAKMIDRRIDGVLAVKAMLTPEQFNKLQQFRQKRMAAGKGFRPGRAGKRQAKMPTGPDEDE